MSRTIVMRAASLAASTGLLALAIAGALSVTYTVQQIIARDPPPIASIEPAPVAPPPAIPHTAPPSQRNIVDSAVAPTPAPAPSAPTPTSFDLPLPPGPPTITNPRWLQTPRELARYYPPRTLSREVEGAATLDCIVDTGGRLNCAIVSETPAGWNFGQAALRISRDYRMAPATRDGEPVQARYRMRVPFEIPR